MFAGLTKVFSSNRETPDPVDEYCRSGNKNDVVNFNALEVTDFSSQYGSETSISYTASNLAGRANIYPNYGDFTQACVFRTYGTWWDDAPSKRKTFKRTPSSFCSQDYIEVVFQRKVFPLKLDIYETYNPGCVVRILACERAEGTDVDTGQIHTRWKTLWEGQPESVAQSSRVFSPILRKCPFATDLIRLELCHRLVKYYTELDCVDLYGSVAGCSEVDGCTSSRDYMHQVGLTSERLEMLSLDSSRSMRLSNQPSPQTNCDLAKEGTCSKWEKEEVEEPVEEEEEASEEDTDSDNGFFDLLPEEVIQLILSFLDVLSLCRVARTCRLLHQHSYDPLQYTELNLQPHWTQVNDIALESLHERSHYLQSLNLSWCHENIVSESAFCSYIEACGNSLRCLYLSSCSFVTSDALKVISTSCPNLTELDVDSCKKITSDGFDNIARLVKLKRLNLYRTIIDQEALVMIIVSCPEIRHLNIGSDNCIHNCDEVLIALGKHASHLKSLDVWRSRTVTDNGVKAIAQGCPHLQEIDIGWCSNVKSSSNSIIELVTACNKMKKLFLTANRTVCDADLLAIAENCKDLEQLDILGTRQVSADAATKVLSSCRKMKLFDVSFCSGIDDMVVIQWTNQFPNVAIKKSFQNSV